MSGPPAQEYLRRKGGVRTETYGFIISCMSVSVERGERGGRYARAEVFACFQKRTKNRSTAQ